MPYQAGDILFGKYRIEALLGQGAFGEVYRVMHLSLKVTRALKVLRHDAPGIGSSEYADGQARFQLEAQLGAQLNSPTPHPNLLQVHNFEAAEDLLVLEMEYAPGGSLAERIQKYRDHEQAFPVVEALQIAVQVASGLAALHARDFIHRDIKPNNILFDQNSHAKVSDFGLAQVPGGPSMRSKLSNPTSHPGTPAYMSPEQTNTLGVLKPPSDIYSLGLVLFEMLTGRNYTFLRPGTRAKALRTEIPVELDELLARMLAKEPDERPWDGAETVEMLREALIMLHSGQDEEQARKKAEAEAAEKARLAQAGEEQRQQAFQEAQRKDQSEAAEKARREAEEQVRQTAQAKARAEAAERALQTEKEARLASERLARENAFQTPAAKPADSRFSFAGWTGPGLIGLAAVVFVVFLIIRSLGGGTPDSLAPTAIGIAAVTDQPSAAPTVITDTPPQSLTQSPTRVPTYTPLPALNAGSTQTREKDGMIMVYVPAGSFTMGSDKNDDEKPVHSVTLDAFWIDQTEVTNAMFQTFAQVAGYQTDAEKAGKSYVFNPTSGNWEETSGANWQHPQGPNSSLSGLSAHPVVHVSWNDASAYCAWAEAMLPSEAEWEKAARGTDGRTYPWGETAPNGKLLNFADVNLALDWADKNTNDGYQFTAQAGNYPAGASPYGALDMAGNVWEWVEDWYAAYPGNTVSNSDYGTKYRVLRGGSWYDVEDDVRSANRSRYNPSDSSVDVGFRCSRSQ